MSTLARSCCSSARRRRARRRARGPVCATGACSGRAASKEMVTGPRNISSLRVIRADDKLCRPEMPQKTAQNTRPEPLGHLADGDPFYAPVGEMRRDGDRVQCHLCGRWLKMVGGQHLLAAHDITTVQYREMFRLLITTSTVASDTQERKRRSMLKQIASGERDQTALNRIATGNVSRWRSLGALRPDLLPEWNSTRNGEISPFAIGQHSHRQTWWRCQTCGPRGGCPTCAIRLARGVQLSHARIAVPQLVNRAPLRRHEAAMAPGIDRRAYLSTGDDPDSAPRKTTEVPESSSHHALIRLRQRRDCRVGVTRSAG